MKVAVLILSFLIPFTAAQAQSLTKDYTVSERPQVRIENLYGQVRVAAEENQTDKLTLKIESPGSAVEEKDFAVKANGGNVEIVVNDAKKRVDLTLLVPVRTRVKVTADAGEVALAGNLESAEVSTKTGTIYTNIPLDSVKYNFLWTVSRPRFLSEVQLEDVEEKAAGKYGLDGKLGEAASKKKEGEKERKGEGEKENPDTSEATDDEQLTTDETAKTKDQKKKSKDKGQRPKDKLISLDFKTERGVILLNIPPSEVPSDLKERPLTKAVKAVVSSGDTILTEAIRKVSPRMFGDYAKTLPPFRGTPALVSRVQNNNAGNQPSVLRRLNVSVSDRFGRAVNDLKAEDFTIFEAGAEREIIGVEPTTASFNLVLLLDVSGSVEERIDFIRKAARSFINTTSPQDKLAVITFRDDIEVLSNFTTDKQKLSDSLDSFDAGGATALYDALAYSLVETLKPLRGERTAVVILSDGDDNRSFIPFEPLLGTIEESGALVYPLYVPSELIPAGRTVQAQAADPIRNRYLTVTTKAEEEAKRLAQVSGGVYFPIRRLEDLQKAYEDVVAQLRTAYSITYRSNSAESNAGVSPRLRVSVKRDGAFVRLGSSIPIQRSQSRNKENTTRDSNAAFQKIGFNFEQIQSSEITGEVKAIKYKPLATEQLREFRLETFDVNRAPPGFVLADAEKKLAVSRRVSPKRTRSYPYERLYNTLSNQKRAAVIPIVKDEGQNGERDFLAWDTISLLNLLEVYAVFGYYDAASKSKRGNLTEQKFNNEFVAAKLKEILNTNLSPHEWNLDVLKNLKQTVEQAKNAYQKISEQTGVALHDQQGLENFVKKLTAEASAFLESSRRKSQKAQTREVLTDQPKETLTTRTKSRITISDYLGGKYFFTVDEAVSENGILYLIESKHTERGKLTHPSDIKDALVKMIFYRNLTDVRQNGKPVKFMPVLRLTASQMQGAITSEAKDEELAKFIALNNFDFKQTNLLKKLFAEARENSFLVKLEKAETKK